MVIARLLPCLLLAGLTIVACDGGDTCQTPPEDEDQAGPVSCTADCGCTSTSCQSAFGGTTCGWNCELESPCISLTLHDGAMTETDIQTYTCIMEKLGAGEEGKYLINYYYGPTPGQYGDRDTLFVLANRQVLLNQTNLQDLSSSVTAVGPLQLNTPDFFQQCVAAADDAARTACIDQLLAAYVCQ